MVWTSRVTEAPFEKILLRIPPIFGYSVLKNLAIKISSEPSCSAQYVQD